VVGDLTSGVGYVPDGFEQRVDVADCRRRIDGEDYRGTAEHVDLADDVTTGKPFGERRERVPEQVAIEQRLAHAPTRSCRSIITPRRR